MSCGFMYYLEFTFMPSVDFTDALLEISELSTIADMWGRWNAIAIKAPQNPVGLLDFRYV
jgi:hypothetical protein